jgi:tetratricopeptide (TPR) repeat protein
MGVTEQVASYGQAWLAGDWPMALRLATEAAEKEPDNSQHVGNQAFSFLALHRLEDALRCYRQVQELVPGTDALALRVGVLLWWLQRPNEAIDAWRNGLEAGYTDPAGGVSCPAFLFFASVRLADRVLTQEANTYLRQRWKPELSTVWPGPVAGYLLNEVDEYTFFRGQTYLNPTLEARRLCQAHFWVGFSHFRKGDAQRYLASLHQAVPVLSATTRAVMLESEYWLAQAELELTSTSRD